MVETKIKLLKKHFNLKEVSRKDKRNKEQMRQYNTNEKLNSIISIIILNINGLNIQNKK